MGGPGRVQGFRAGYGVVCACVAVGLRVEGLGITGLVFVVKRLGRSLDDVGITPASGVRAT